MEVRTGYKQTEVGVIPEEWACVRIGESIDLLTGFPFPSRGYSKSGVRLLRGSNVKRGVTDWSEEGTEYWPAISSEIKKYVLKSGDIVIAMDGSLVGRSFAMLSENDVPALLLQRVARIRSSAIDQKFLKAWVCSQRFTAHCDAVKTVTAIPHISPADIRSFTIALPPTKAEQEAIAEVLSKADALIECLERLIAKKRLLKLGVMQELLTGRRRLRGFADATKGFKQTEVGVIPADWAVTSMGELFTFQNGVNAGRAAYGKGIPFINVLEVITYPTLTETKIPGRISLPPQTSSAFRVQTGDVLFNRTSETQEEVGLASVYTDNREVLFGGFVIRARPRDSSLDPIFSSYALRSPAIRRQIVSRGQGAVRANIGQQELSKVRVFVPSLPEQEAIAAILLAMDAEIALLEAQFAKYRQIKQGLMQNLLTGRIRLV